MSSITNANVMSSNLNITGSFGTNGSVSSQVLVGVETAIRVPPPKGWKTYKAKNKQGWASVGPEEIHESPANGKATYCSSLNIGTMVGQFHWQVYHKQHPDVQVLYSGIAGDESANVVAISNVLFLDGIEHDQFEEWLEVYQERFGTREALYSYRFPPPPARLGNLLPIPWVHSSDDHINVADWLTRQCMKPVYAVGEMFFFQTEEDAVAYKLKFS